MRPGSRCPAGRRPGRLLALLLGLAPLSPPLTAQDLRLPAVFGEHMVLQRGATAPLWGRAAPGAEVRVEASWRDGAVTARAAADGRWRLALPLPETPGPHRLVVRCGQEVRVLGDVLVGDVWLCSGQSNMEMTVGPAPHSAGPVRDWEEEAAAADLPGIRFFTVARQVALAPAEDCRGTWTVVRPETVGRCTAAGFFFAREIHRRLGVPVGLLHASWGGTVAEAWTSPTGLAPLGDFATALAELERLRRDPPPPLEERRQAWWRTLEERDPGGAGAWARAQLDDTAWGRTGLPGPWDTAQGLADFDGVVWYRREFMLPPELTGRELLLETGPIDDMDTVWLDGRRLAGTEMPGAWNRPRSYLVPAALARPGRHILALRILDTGGPGGMSGTAGQLRLRPREGGGAPVSLAGSWRWRQGVALAGLPSFPVDAGVGPNTPTALYHGMLAPLVPYGIRGVLWYQGESNRLRGRQYRRLFPALIRDWRRLWAAPALPFLFVQIAPFAYRGDQGQAAELREAQFLTARQVPHSGMVVTLDIGDPRDIHPKDKQEVGRRLALLALHRVYGQAEVVDSGPVFREVRREGARLRVLFDGVHGGLATRDGGPPARLQVAGADRVFRPATGRIEGDTLLVWNPEVLEPLAVRYAWGAADEASLTDASGLPASSFRSDDW